MIRKNVFSHMGFVTPLSIFCIFILKTVQALAKRPGIIRPVVPAAPGDPLTYKDEEGEGWRQRLIPFKKEQILSLWLPGVTAGK